MKRIIDMWRYSILLLIVSGVCFHALAQNVAFIASPSSPRIGVKDMVQVTFTIRNVDNLSELRPSGFGDFNHVDGPFQSTSVNFVNGARSSSISLTYVLQPRHEGKITIPAATAKDASGHTYQSNPVTIDVVAGTLAQPQHARQPSNGMYDDDDDPFMQMAQQMQRIQQMQQQMLQQRGMAQPAQPRQVQPAQPQKDAPVNDAEIAKDLFIRVTVDKSKVHVGEQITTSYKLYSRLPMQVAISKLPSLNGFWTQDFEIPKMPKPQEEVVDGKKYQVFLLKKSALFPQEAGVLELDPAEAKGSARVVQQVKRRAADMFADPFGRGTLMMNDPFFNNAMFNTMAYKDVPVHLKSSPIKITVLPQPEKDKPEHYGGAVGNFTFSGKLDKKELTTDDVATLTLTINGSGNLKLIETPKLNLPNGINTYDPQIIDTITGRSTTITGAKIITYAITPHTAGEYEIPSVEFSWFNPATGKYSTERTQPFKIHVKPGKHYNPGHVAGNTNFVLKDIHDIIPNPAGGLQLNARPLLHTPLYWSLYVLPVLAFIGMMVWRKRNEELSRDTMKLRNRRANKIALQRLVTARKLLDQNQRKPFYEEISKAIWLYLSDKSGIPLSALSKESAQAAMAAKKVPAALQKQFESVIWDCESALYASGANKKMEHTYEEAVKVISDFEEVI